MRLAKYINVLCDHVKDILEQEPRLLKIASPCYVLGTSLECLLMHELLEFIYLLVRLDCAGFWSHVWKLGQSGCAGLETSLPFNLHPKGVRVRCWGTQRRRIHGGVLARIPLIWVDPRTAVRAWRISGDPNCRNPPWTGNAVACRSGALNGKPP